MIDEHYLNLAETMATFSDAEPRGAILVKDGKITAIAAAHFPVGVKVPPEHEGLANLMTVHPEFRAIWESGQSASKGATIYTSLPPCPNCAGYLIEAKVAEIVTRPVSEEYRKQWAGALELAASMLQQAKITLRTVESRHDGAVQLPEKGV